MKQALKKCCEVVKKQVRFFENIKKRFTFAPQLNGV